MSNDLEQFVAEWNTRAVRCLRDAGLIGAAEGSRVELTVVLWPNEDQSISPMLTIGEFWSTPIHEGSDLPGDFRTVLGCVNGFWVPAHRSKFQDSWCSDDGDYFEVSKWCELPPRIDNSLKGDRE